MKHKILVITLVVFLSSFALANSWNIAPSYLRLNQAIPGGHSDNYGVNLSYDWDIYDRTTFGAEILGSWSNDAELYGFGVNLKHGLIQSGGFTFYLGGYADFIHATNLQSELPGLDKYENGLMYGPLFGMKWHINDQTSFFTEYRYGWFDGGGIRNAFDEANMFMLGLELKF